MVLVGNIRPGGKKRTEAPHFVVVHHSIFSPVFLPGEENEAHASFGVEWVGDLEGEVYGCRIVYTASSC
jgi:hypothetical protein